MATIDILCQRDPPNLVRINVPLDPGELPERLIYGFPSFESWLQNDVPNLVSGRLRSQTLPDQQLDNILYEWISGQSVIYGRMFKDLMPHRDEVWELKTVDLRIFGWMYRPLMFIAVFGDYADLYKGRNAKKSYEDAVKCVVRARNSIDLDEPKIAYGTFDDLVSV